MRLMEDLTRAAAMEVRGSLRFDYLGRELDLESPWRHDKFIDLVSEAVGEELTLQT